MKNILTRFAFLILVFHCYSISAQVQQEQLIGTWILDYSKSINTMSEQSKKDYALISEGIKKLYEQSFKVKTIIFNDNGSFVQQIVNGQQLLGTWVLDNNKNIIIKNQQGNPLVFKIVTLSATIMVLLLQKKENEQTVLSNWYLNKN